MTDTSYRQQMFSLIEAWQASGLSQKAFCEQQALSPHRFQYWRRRFKDRNNAPAPAPAFIPLTFTHPAAPRAEIVYPDGKRLLLHHSVDAAFLKALLA